MATMIQNAAKGQRKAMEQLYEGNKQKVYYVSLCLIGDKALAAQATYGAFKDVLENIKAYGIETEEDFAHMTVRKAAEWCKKKISKADARAFRQPNNRNFLITDVGGIAENTKNAEKDVLQSIPDLQRFIFVLHIVGDYLPEQIAALFKFDMKTINAALEAEELNVERVARMTDKKANYKSIVGNLRDGLDKAKFPESTDEKVNSVIDGIATPIERKKKKQNIITGISVAVVILLIIGIVLAATREPADTDTDESTYTSDTLIEDDTVVTYDETQTSYITEPVIDLDETLTYYADIEIADYGTVTVELDQNAAPVTVANFVYLAQSGFYDGLTFHRIMEGFMMQGGDPNGDGTGGYTDADGNEVNIVGEFEYNGYDNTLSHTRGAISMAHATDYNSASSQFFIVHEDSSESLDGLYAAFGYVTEGMDIVDTICETAEPTDDNGTIEADAQPVITSVTIRTA